MAALPLPPKHTTSRELLRLARAIERYSRQRRGLLAKVEELDNNIKAAKAMFRRLADLLAAPVVAAVVDELCPWCGLGPALHELGSFDACASKPVVS